MANEKVIAGLQTIVTDLGQQADGHQLQSRIFAGMGFAKNAQNMLKKNAAMSPTALTVFWTWAAK